MAEFRIASALTVCLLLLARADNTWQGWWYKGGGMRTISPMCNDWKLAGAGGREQLEMFLEDMAADGVGTISFNAIYRADKDTEALWCGLAGGDYKSPNTFMFENTDAARAFVASAHAKGIAVLSWMNPSYIYTGSSMFKETNHLDCLQQPTLGSCRYFDWKATNASYAKRPADKNPKGGFRQDSFVNDGGSAYYSYWAAQPTVDWRSPTWIDEWKSICDFWLQEVGIDGFVFDYPDGYHPIGSDAGQGSIYTPTLAHKIFSESVTGPVTGPNFNTATKAAFGELYAAPGRAARYGLSGSLADDASGQAIGGGGSRDDGKLWNIHNGDAVNLDTFYGVTWNGGVGGIDSFTALCRNQDIDLGSIGCTVPWARVEVTTAPGASKVNRLSVAIPLLGGAFVAIEYIDQTWWSAERWTGSDTLRSIYSAVQKNSVLQPLMLRAPLCFSGSAWPCNGNSGSTASKGLYAMYRWDPFASGQIALVVFNLGNSSLTANLDLEKSLGEYFAPGVLATNLLTGKAACDTLSANFKVQVPAQDVVVIGGNALLRGRRWKTYPGKSYNCKDHGTVWPAMDKEGQTQFTNKLSMPQCLMICARSKNCNAVTVSWTFIGDSISSTLSSCWLRSVPDITKCVTQVLLGENASEYNTFTLNTPGITSRDLVV